MDERDIWRLAARLMEMFEDGAEMAAAMYADKALARGNRQVANTWNRIAAAIQALERKRPGRRAVN